MSNDEMTMRDKFAMAALNGLLLNPQIAKDVVKQKFSARYNQEWHANTAYQFADEMMKRRDIPPEDMDYGV